MEHKFLNIKGINLREFLREIPGVTSNVPINFIHDVNAVLAGEIWKGNARGFSNAAVVTLGTGLGFAFSKDEKIQCNSLGGPLVSVYNIPFKDGILEDYTGRKGFLRIYKKISGKSVQGIDVSDIAYNASMGDLDCIATFHEVAEILSEALHDVLIENKIQCLLFGGQISRSFQHLERTLKEDLIDIESLHKISLVKSIDNASFLGTLKVFWEDSPDFAI
jgi:glucokinase